MGAFRIILVPLLFGAVLRANPVPPSWALGRLQLAVAPERVSAGPGAEMALPADLPFVFPAPSVEPDEPREEAFRPHASLVEEGPAAVNARELLQRARSKLHGSFAVGIDSRGGWEARLELFQQLSESISLGIGIHVGRYERWGWD